MLKTYMSGYEWEVQFDSGRRFRLPAREFAAESQSAWHTQVAPSTNGFVPREAVLELDQFRARQTLEALRLGIVPVQDVATLTIGLEAERVSLDRALARSVERSGDVLAVIGDYGYGKSHFVELAAQRALRENMLAAVASLDLVETPPSKANEIYKALIASLRYPDGDDHERGLRPLIKRALAHPGVVGEFAARSPRTDDPLAAALGALAECGGQAAYDDIVTDQRVEDLPEKAAAPVSGRRGRPTVYLPAHRHQRAGDHARLRRVGSADRRVGTLLAAARQSARPHRRLLQIDDLCGAGAE